MKISTKKGDAGECSLMFNKRVSKACTRVCAYGNIDEFCASLGLARALCQDHALNQKILDMQNSLILLMTELATSNEDFTKLSEKNIAILQDPDLKKIEDEISKIEAQGETFKGWTMSGDNQFEAALNMARALCRKAERAVVFLFEKEPPPRTFALTYLNRISDLIYLWSVMANKSK